MAYRTLGNEGAEIALRYRLVDVSKRSKLGMVKRKAHIDVCLQRDEVVVEGPNQG
jgi:hypothetical protein